MPLNVLREGKIICCDSLSAKSDSLQHISVWAQSIVITRLQASYMYTRSYDLNTSADHWAV